MPTVSSRSFILGLIFRSLIHFEFIFVYGVIKCSSFILLQVVDQFSQHHLLFKEIVFSPLYILASFVKDKVSIGAWIYLWQRPVSDSWLPCIGPQHVGDEVTVSWSV